MSKKLRVGRFKKTKLSSEIIFQYKTYHGIIGVPVKATYSSRGNDGSGSAKIRINPLEVTLEGNFPDKEKAVLRDIIRLNADIGIVKDIPSLRHRIKEVVFFAQRDIVDSHIQAEAYDGY